MNKNFIKYPFRKRIYILVMLFALLLTGCTNKIDGKINENNEQETQVIEDKQTESNQEESSVDIDVIEETKEDKENSKVSKDVITYGKVEYEDSKIAFKNLVKKADKTKDKGTSGIITKGANGISRKEVRKVYKDGKYSHKEVVKDSYVFKAPVNHQEWYGTKVKKQDDSLEKQINEVVRLTNEERKKENLSPLKIHNKLTGVANTRAKDITKLFDHKRPNGSEITTLLTDIKYQMIGENIAYGQRTPAEVVKGWMDSQGHRRNILTEEYTHIGVGLVENAKGIKYWAQLFLK